MSDSEENRSGASSALLNIASAYSDSESSQETNEDFKTPKSLGGLVENLRAEIRKSESEVTKASDGQGRTNSSLAGHAGDVEKSQSVTKIVRLDSGKVVKISATSGSKASEARQEETQAKQAPVTEVTSSFRSPDSIAPDQQTPTDDIPSSGGTVLSTPGPETAEPGKVAPVVDKETLGEGETCEVDQNADTAKDIEVGAGDINNDKECFQIQSELNGQAESANLIGDTSLESENTECSEIMGSRSSKESAKLDDEKNVESRAEESPMEVDEEVSGEVESSDPNERHLLSSSSGANIPTGGDLGDRERDISESLGTLQESTPIQDLDVTLGAESADLELKTESNILNAYLESKLEEEEAKEPEAERKDSVEAEISEVTTQPENRSEDAEMGETEKLTTAGSVADSKEKEEEIVILEQSENSCSVIDEETLTNNSDIFEIKPRPELKLARSETVKARPPIGAAEAAAKKSESELQASSPALYKMLESCDSHQPAPAEPDVKKTTGSGPIKLKRNFSSISAAAKEQQEKRLRPEEPERNRSDDDSSDITVLPSSPEISSQRLDSVRSPSKTQIPAQPAAPSTFHQEPYQTAFGKINSSSNQAFQSPKKSPQSVPQVSQRVTRREEHKRTLPLILRKADISSSKREASKQEDSSSKASTKKEEAHSNVSSTSTEAGISMATASSESREQSTSVPFSSSSSNQDMSNSEGPTDFGNVVSSKETKVPPLTEDSGSDNAMPTPTDGDETKQPTSSLSQPTPPVEMPTIIVPKKRGRPRKFPLPETAPLVATWPTQEKSKSTPKTSKRRKSGKTKVEKEPVVETPKKRSLPRYKKKKKPGEEEEETEAPRTFNKKGRMEVMTEGCKPVTVSQITEYFWPPISSLPAGEKPEGLMIQEQISEYLGVKSFKRKYPSIKRRPVDMEERNYLQENGYVSENMCDMGLTAVYSADIIEIMYNDFPHKFEEYRKHTREKKMKEQKALREKQAAENMDPRKEALESAVSWNSEFNKTRLNGEAEEELQL